MKNDLRDHPDKKTEVSESASVVFMDRFRFDSLSKYMKPFYADLVLHENANEEERAEVWRNICRGFYRRIRKYRGLTIDRVAEICRVTIEEVEALERGEREHEKRLILGFIHACGAHLEYEIFVQKILEFKNPGARARARGVAKPLLRQWGLLIPGVDYQSLNSERGKLMLLSRKTESDSMPVEFPSSPE